MIKLSNSLLFNTCSTIHQYEPLQYGKTTYITVSTYHGISRTPNVYADHPTRHAPPMGTHDNYSTPCYINSSVEITAARWSAARRNAILKIPQRESDVVGTLVDARFGRRYWFGSVVLM